ncbi:MAG: SMC-Scp complex subunit ScpB [Kiritimatiellae bacterium]|nr:SMC-Scp complex subunit ScpB [Kiritimatiellia bacterium]
MEPEEEKNETPVESPVETPAETPAEVPAEVPIDAAEVPVDAVDADAPAEERKPTPMPKPKEPKIPLPASLQEIVGALLFASQTPLTITDLRQCIRGVEPEEGDNAEVMGVFQSCTTREVEQAVHGLEKELERSGCGFRLVCAGGAYRLQTAPACGRYVRALLKLDRPNRLSRAALETLAIVAYRQPITKSEVEQIRGVAVDTIMKTLVDLQLVRLVGRSELPGHPFLYGTTPLFLEHFGLASLSELNAIDPTLQRSNPRERAKLFVKKEKPKEEAPTLEDAAREAAEEAAAASTDSAAAADESIAAPDTASFDGEEDDDGEATPTTSARIGSTGVNDDDDIFIDDTPDEFDDDDDDDDLDEEELDDEEMDDEEDDNEDA